MVLHVAAPAGARFGGAELAAAFAAEGLQYGELRIYHLRALGDTGPVLFSVANMVEPGHFEPETMDALSTPGVVLLQQLPGPQPGPEAFQSMLEVAQRLADRLDGELWDERRNPLTVQRMESLQAELVEYERRRRLPGVLR